MALEKPITRTASVTGGYIALVMALDHLRRRFPTLPVLMVTASANRDVVEESLSRGAVDCLLKSFEPVELRDKVFRILRKDIL